MSVNKVILVGNVGKDPVIRHLDGNMSVCTFPLATSEVYKKSDGERVSTTEWHNIVLWRGLAEVAERYVKKGSQLYIEGRIKTRSYEDQGGNKKYVTEIVGDVLQMLDRKPVEPTTGTGTPGPYPGKGQPSTDSGNEDNDDNSPDSPMGTDTDDLPF